MGALCRMTGLLRFTVFARDLPLTSLLHWPDSDGRGIGRTSGCVAVALTACSCRSCCGPALQSVSVGILVDQLMMNVQSPSGLRRLASGALHSWLARAGHAGAQLFAVPYFRRGGQPLHGGRAVDLQR